MGGKGYKDCNMPLIYDWNSMIIPVLSKQDSSMSGQRNYSVVEIEIDFYLLNMLLYYIKIIKIIKGE